MLQALDLNNYASSLSGYVISFLLVCLVGMVAVLYNKLDKKDDTNSQAIARLTETFSQLTTSVAVLANTVSTLSDSVKELKAEQRKSG